MDTINITRTYVENDAGMMIGYVSVNLFAKPGINPWRAYVRHGHGIPVGSAATKEAAIEIVRKAVL